VRDQVSMETPVNQEFGGSAVDRVQTLDHAGVDGPSSPKPFMKLRKLSPPLELSPPFFPSGR
jgi:hypothetical protein